MCVEGRVSRIDAFGREREEEVDARLQTARLEHRLHQLLGRAWIRRRFENDQHAWAQMLRDLLDRRHDVRHVGIFRLPERRRDADVDRVELGDDGEVAGRLESSIGDEARDLGGRHVGNV